MAYHLMAYFAFFLPLVVLIYQLAPKKVRPGVLLCASYFFFWTFSGKLVLYLICATFLAHEIGLWLTYTDEHMEGDHKAITKRKRRILALGILLNLAVLFVLKYTNFFGQAISQLLAGFHVKWDYKVIKFGVPIGLSFYTLQVISYMTDVYRGTRKAEEKLSKLALYLAFFPQLMEGPIARFHETADALWEGRPVTYQNLTYGAQRILWGLFKKMLIADRLNAVVSYVYARCDSIGGGIALLGAVSYTIQLYMEFSGSLDMIIGSGQIFGITLPENFRQPFFAKNASDFWRRWHITLGTFFKDYIFYPVSLAKPVKNFAKKVKTRCGRGVSKFVAPTIALFCVWTCNGLWHGANWTFIFYGMYYFVLIFLENVLEAPVNHLLAKRHTTRDGIGFRIFASIKLMVIVVIGEMFFRAPSMSAGWAMLRSIVTNFNLSDFHARFYLVGMDWYDWVVVCAGVLIVFLVDLAKEKQVRIREWIAGRPLPARYAFWYAMILTVVVFGAYGSGYTVADLIYAGY